MPRVRRAIIYSSPEIANPDSSEPTVCFWPKSVIPLETAYDPKLPSGFPDSDAKKRTVTLSIELSTAYVPEHVVC